MKEIDASINREEGGEEKEKERKEEESVYTETFSILNKNGLGKGKTDLKIIVCSLIMFTILLFLGLFVNSLGKPTLSFSQDGTFKILQVLKEV